MKSDCSCRKCKPTLSQHYFLTKSMKKLMLLWLSTEALDGQTDWAADDGQNWTSLSRNEHSGSKSSESRSRPDSKLLSRFLSTTVFGSSSLSSSVDVWGPAERLSGSTSSGVIRDALLVTFGNVVFRQSSFLEFVLFGNVAFGHSTFGNGGDSSASGDLKKGGDDEVNDCKN
jgi:hypothetical protein